MMRSILIQLCKASLQNLIIIAYYLEWHRICISLSPLLYHTYLKKWYLTLKFYAFQSCGVCLIHDSYCNLISISGCEIKLFDMFLNCRWTFKIEFKILFAFVKFVVKFSMRIGLTLVLVLRWLLVITVTHIYTNYAVNSMMNL